MSNLVFGTKFVYKMNIAFRSNFCRIYLFRFDAAIIWLYKASLKETVTVSRDNLQCNKFFKIRRSNYLAV